MLYSKVVLKLVIIWSCFLGGKSASNDLPFNEKLITSLRNDVNLDLPVDEEYEDLRAELLAYHTALATLSDTATRRSMKSTSCWNLGGICINYKLCEGYKYISEAPGCKDKLNVCCFAWNKFYVRDWSDNGLYNIAFPWRHPQELGGKGILKQEVVDKGRKIKKKKLKEKELPRVSSEVIVEKENVQGRKIKKKRLNQKELTGVSSEVIGQEEPVKRSYDIIYDNAFPWNDPNEFAEKVNIESEPETFELRKKPPMANEMSDNDFQKKSILRNLRSRLPFIMVSLETE